MQVFSRRFQIHRYIFRRNMATTPLLTSACLIVGDEVLNGKIHDKNSNSFAKLCFSYGISLNKIETVPDSARDIADSIQRLARDHDMVVTSGGIGPTHDDITYESIAAAFGLTVKLHDETVIRMKRLGKRQIDPKSEPEVYAAQMRMATLPYGPSSDDVDVLYPVETSWVPVVVVRKKVFILPGIPMLFNSLLAGVLPSLIPRIPPGNKPLRLLVSTSKPESVMAPFLTRLQASVDDKGIKIGSYPHMTAGVNTVSIIGKVEFETLMRDLVKQTEEALQGKEISVEEEESLSAKS
ncbi:MoaB/Mog domain-containing protein [Lipomyces oligophaga]|uniref:MoaB/Mog domain-containing protein n=1 Tax=Lipomyces oligophaga TaxID=45792 RepID=UPI0034CF0617